MERIFNTIEVTPGTSIQSLFRMQHGDGTWRWLEATIGNSTQVPGIEGYVVNFRDVSQRKLAEERLEAQLLRLGTLQEIDLAIASSSDLQFTLSVVLEQVVSSLRADAAAVLLYDPISSVLRFSAQRGFSKRNWVEIEFRLGQGYAGSAAINRRMEYIPDIRKEESGGAEFDLLESEGFISLAAATLIVKGELIGVMEVYFRSAREVDQDWLDFFQTLAGQTAIAVNSAKLFDGLQRSNLELTLAYDRTIEGWSHALDLRDRETEGHTQRVTNLTLSLCRMLDVEEGKLVHVRRGALLHDIGKMGVPDQILLKPGPLSDEEWVMMKQHPRLAFELLSPISFLRPALDIPYCHHEMWDGAGYPRGLKGEEIPLEARIFAVVDVWDALTSDRPYRKAWTSEASLAHIRDQSGKHFDPRVVEVFLEMIPGK
jgi:putative nucleotidyltransferase with HDIG domain